MLLNVCLSVSSKLLRLLAFRNVNSIFRVLTDVTFRSVPFCKGLSVLCASSARGFVDAARDVIVSGNVIVVLRGGVVAVLSNHVFRNIFLGRYVSLIVLLDWGGRVFPFLRFNRAIGLIHAIDALRVLVQRVVVSLLEVVFRPLALV